MKKQIFIILIFAIISFLITGILINIKNTKSNTSDNDITNSDNDSNSTSIDKKEKTIDLYGMYNENDIELEKITKKYNDINQTVDIPQIKGLKNKKIENKINNDIENKIDNAVNELLEKKALINNFYYNSNTGFSNIISVPYSISYSLNGEWNQKIICLNYELVNGETLKFEDLFKKDTDLESIIRRIYYRKMSSDSVIVGEMSNKVEYDYENKIWVQEQYFYDEKLGERIEKVEYVPSLTEYDINKKIAEHIKEKQEEFYFTPSRLYIDDYYFIYFTDIANEVVIYDKYLTNESIYENNNIGKKNLWTCSEANYNSDYRYREYGFAEDNLFYEINMDYYQYDNTAYPFKKSVTKLNSKLMETANEKLNQYRNVAKQNQDKFYVLLLQPSVNYEGVYYNGYREYTFLISTNVSENEMYVDMSSKQEVINKIIDGYRYYNLAFYEYSGLSFISYEINDYVSNKENIVRNEELKMYDARTLKELTSFENIFKEGVDYNYLINDWLLYEINRREIKNEDIENVLNNTEIYFDIYGISAKLPGYNYDITLKSFSNIDKSLLKIYDLEMYIISESNTRKIEKEEIQNLSLDELNKAYNEIFARYGHSFKNAELREYFKSLEWYNEIENKTVSLEELNEIERYNLNIIKSVIDEKKAN